MTKKIFLTGAAGLPVALLFLAWTFYSRRRSQIEFQQSIDQNQMEAGRRFRAAYGSDDVRISGFTVNPAQIRRGQETLFCYGVMNAKVVRLDPPIDRVHPALSYCFNATPARTTTFTLTAEDAAGKAVRQSVTVDVR